MSTIPVPAPTKKAVLVGVCSKLARDFKKIPGALEDVMKLGKLLIDTYQYKKDDVIILINPNAKDKGPDLKDLPTNLPLKSPTEDNILEAMRGLVAGAQVGDHIFFSYSGHGAQIKPMDDKNETDNQDEILAPSDFKSDGTNSGPYSGYSHFIRDDKIREIFVDGLREGVHCTLLFDCCHSGTACDLPEVKFPVEVNGGDSGAGEVRGSLPKPGAPGFTGSETVDHGHAASHIEKPSSSVVPVKDVTSWAACSDEQLTYGGPNGGYFVDAFVQIMSGPKGKTIKYKDLLLDLQANLKDVTDKFNQRDAPSPPYEVPRPQLGSLRPDRILDEVFTL